MSYIDKTQQCVSDALSRIGVAAEVIANPPNESALEISVVSLSAYLTILDNIQNIVATLDCVSVLTVRHGDDATSVDCRTFDAVLTNYYGA